MRPPPLLLLHPDDNVLVARAEIAHGDALLLDGETIFAPDAIAVGHKAARHALDIGQKVIKYGAPIGSITAPVQAGGHVHVHNMESDYIATHLRDAVAIEKSHR